MGECGGHQGVTKTHRNMSELLWWPRSKEFVQHFVQECAICARNLPVRNLPRTHEGTLEQPFFMSRVSMDYVGPRAFQGQEYYIIVCIVARVTLVKTAAVTRNLFAESAVAALGVPFEVYTDGGTEFKGDFHDHVTSVLKVKHINAAPYLPRQNGLNESIHRTLEAHATRGVRRGISLHGRKVQHDKLTRRNERHKTCPGARPATDSEGEDFEPGDVVVVSTMIEADTIIRGKVRMERYQASYPT
ncbi:integrase core domain protein [Gregarina niphandrodes]|uniref:Integrase core domain protein n=1 Tax=Gregarina niphandrodes TaxID=110365 RepID=A0A023AXN0_GRENI|nr:integrase core domain protein [Gregarina niphandrodes]EZG43055.1 integrase core domain protein [Gregarina niphandrodes]|eukprot:XP_011133670.1 integrase core domain protein [Gregarina niphandrodes]